MAQLPDVVQHCGPPNAVPRQRNCRPSGVHFAESEAFLIHSSIDEVDDQTAAKLRKSAAEAALRAIQIDPTSIQALLFLRQSDGTQRCQRIDPLRDEPLSPEGSSRLRAWRAMYIAADGVAADR